MKQVPLAAALILLAAGGLFLIEKAERQAHDTTRKHHLQDIEDSLYFARSLHGSFPPYEESTWCGFLNDPNNRLVRDQVEATLRAQNEKYANVDKPFPQDPLVGLVSPVALPASHSLGDGWAKWGQSKATGVYDYFYWKRSPSTFELYAVLEEEKSGERNSYMCENAPPQTFDYGIASIQRERNGSTIIEGPL